MSTRKINKAGLDLIKGYEKCKLQAYKAVPTEQYYTIGYGHYGPDVDANMTITQEKADELFKNDLTKFENFVNNSAYCPVTDQLNENQFAALVSFTYNCGQGNLKKLCAGRTLAQIAATMPSFNKSGGKVLQGLVKRRAAEVILFNTPAPGGQKRTPPTYSNSLLNVLKNKSNNPYPEPKTDLRRGNKSEYVKWVQWHLQRKKYLEVAIDGEYGPKTENAVKIEQRKNSITATGVVNAVTKAYLKK